MKGFAIAMLLLLAASAASGYPPYEHDIGAITTATGRIEIREGYVDGIILSDPIRFVAYSAGSNIVAATD
ncbi:MAG: hypothetical protein M9935_10640 [Kiritimatiellae bacterium]|nr:hypothetical protein [Kiritimatiellia bacterium]